jgi:putative FmdB family regulatory protein
MPIFEYRCRECGKEYEELVYGDRDKVVPCPACGSKNSDKLMSAIGGISMGGSSAPACGESCASAHSCAAAGGGCCPHAH